MKGLGRDLSYTQRKYFDKKQNISETLVSFFKDELKMSKSEITDLKVEDFYKYGFSTLISNKGYRLNELKDMILRNW